MLEIGSQREIMPGMRSYFLEVGSPGKIITQYQKSQVSPGAESETALYADKTFAAL